MRALFDDGGFVEAAFAYLDACGVLQRFRSTYFEGETNQMQDARSQTPSQPLSGHNAPDCMGDAPKCDCPPFSVILPAYNEEHGIGGTLDQLREALKAASCEYEILVVNDGSTDKTAEVLASVDNVRVIQHRYNRGYGAALKTGIRHAKYPLIVITDSDGTYPNERVPILVRLAVDEDMVVGSRTGPNVEYPLIRKIPKWFLKRFAEWMARQRIPDLNSGLRVFRKDVVARFLNILPNGFSFTTTITLAMLTNGYSVRYEPIDYCSRTGKSKIKPIRDTLNFVQLILRTGMYFAPLRVFLPIGLLLGASFAASVVYDVFVLHDLTEKTLLLLLFGMNTVMFALLADMIDKRTG